MQSLQWKHPSSPLPRSLRQFLRKGSDGLSLLDSQGVIMVDYLELGRTINAAYFAAKLRRFRQEIAKERRGKLTRGVLLLQDNAPAHTSQVAMNDATQ